MAAVPTGGPSSTIAAKRTCKDNEHRSNLALGNVCGKLLVVGHGFVYNLKR